METRRPAVDRARQRVVRRGGRGRRRGSAGAYRPRSIQRLFRVSVARDLARAEIKRRTDTGQQVLCWDNDTHLWFKRAKSSEVLLGDTNYHRELMLQNWPD
jgi:hypothetical protein